MVMSIISACFCIPFLILSAVGLSLASQRRGYSWHSNNEKLEVLSKSRLSLFMLTVFGTIMSLLIDLFKIHKFFFICKLKTYNWKVVLFWRRHFRFRIGHQNKKQKWKANLSFCVKIIHFFSGLQRDRSHPGLDHGHRRHHIVGLLLQGRLLQKVQNSRGCSLQSGRTSRTSGRTSGTSGRTSGTSGLVPGTSGWFRARLCS